jgi:large subunit ribosomal protein L31
MKSGIHPSLNFVIFVDASAGVEFRSRSTMKSRNTRTVDGVEYFVVPVDVSSASHPFYTGKQRATVLAGRVDKFNKKYKLNQG